MISLNLNQLLKDQNKTAYWLSQQTGIAPNNVGKIVNGETKNIRLDTIEKICKALNCTPGDLIVINSPSSLTKPYTIKDDTN